MDTDIWVFKDSRVGNTNQAIALAQEIGLRYNIQDIKYNIFAKLPNFVLQYKPIHINSKIIRLITASKLPRLIISAGRRTAPLALRIKKQSNNEIKVVQIMHPAMPLKHFDLVVLPQHDTFSQVSSNAVRIIGALNNIKSKINIGKQEITLQYPHLQQFIAVLIGGNTKNYKQRHDDARDLLSILIQIANNNHIPLFISFSRRTPSIIKQMIYANFQLPHTVYDPETNKPNPYLGLLSEAKYIISTADSISMCSEAAATGKPLYIYCPYNFKLKKHKFFIQQLVDLGIARRLDHSITSLHSYSYQPLYEVEKVAKIIRSEFC